MYYRTLKLLVIAGSLLSIVLSYFILFGEHNWFGDRPEAHIDIAKLPETPTGPEVLERYPKLRLRCQTEQTQLGAQICATRVKSFNGVPAKHVVFYFDAQQKLTAFKVTVDLPQYQALRNQVMSAYGPPRMQNNTFIAVRAGDGILTFPAELPLDEADFLWLYNPRAPRTIGNSVEPDVAPEQGADEGEAQPEIEAESPAPAE